MQGLSFTVTSGLSLIKSPKSQEKKAECLGWVASSGLLCIPQSGVLVQNGSKSGFNQMYLIPASRDEVAFALDSSSKQHFAEIVGVGCVLNGVRYKNGETFQPNCKYNCTCINGAVGCVPMCTNSRPPLVWCPNPKLIKMAGKCCEQWVCDDSRKIRKTSPRHISSAAYEGEDEAWQKNCIVHTSPWSPCSKTCGLGISTRISNDNDQCRLLKESRLCNMRPCEVDISQHIKPGKKCLAVYRANEPMNYTISGCVSKSPYRPKYCGVCTDNRCCTPYKSKTIEVRFQCPDGTEFSWKIMWINACFCNLNCRNPNDIFADLGHYYDYSEIAN
ncbi:CCN family member 4 isoform X4 [Anomalospiza imberbis]|uniref:CCN family member 4 isoform X4 n=1 Tax=Anomalospiza imberbis TaxID=187417 RepID=UPI00358F9204